MQLGAAEKDPIRYADWAELQVLYSGETAISFESIRTEADVEGLLEEQDPSNISLDPSEACELLIADAVREFERRIAYGGKGYPFRIRGDRLELRPGVNRWTPYAFCLMVCDRDYWTNGDPSSWMFEYVASNALRAYLQGCAYRFGAPREAPDDKIEDALRRLAEKTGDPVLDTYPIKSTDKDLGLDVVGWKNFADRQTSKFLVYMQCATGENWMGKRGDLDLSTAGVWNKTISWTTPPVKALAIPYIVSPGQDWQRATPGLLLMDRLRIASLLPARAISITGIDWLSWFKNRVEEVSQSLK